MTCKKWCKVCGLPVTKKAVKISQEVCSILNIQNKDYQWYHMECETDFRKSIGLA